MIADGFVRGARGRLPAASVPYNPCHRSKKLTNIHLALLLIGSYRKNIGKKYEKTSENNFDCMADVFGLGLENKKVGHLVRLEH
jgi:hypothetical protein